MNSFATTYYTFMDNMNSNSTSAEKILEDLKQLQQKMQSHTGDSDPLTSKKNALAVFKIFQNMDLEKWESIARESSHWDWIALPLKENELSALKHLQERIKHLAHLTEHDPLTGLANRRAMTKSLDMEIDRCIRSGSSLSVAMLDLDDFKKVNDTYGHPCGDLVLQQFSQVINSEIRKTDLAARFGGEEFVILLSGTSLIKAQHVLKRIKDKCAELVLQCSLDQNSFQLTCSIGLVCFKGKNNIESEDLLQAADQALYQAKAEGKNKIITAPLADFATNEHTLVGREEKHFLFSK